MYFPWFGTSVGDEVYPQSEDLVSHKATRSVPVLIGVAVSLGCEGTLIFFIILLVLI